MLPSKGKFALYACPYLPGSCGRPYCQFSHSDASNTLSAGVTSSILEINQQINASYSRNAEESIEPSSLSLASIKDEPEDEDDLIPQLEALFGMEGAPKSLLNELETPKYEPTPISELKSMPRNSVIDTLDKYSPQRPVKAKAIKTEVEEYIPTPANIEEYVPTASLAPTTVASYVPTKKSSQTALSQSSSSSSKHKDSKSGSKSSSSSSKSASSSKKSESHKSSSKSSSSKSTSSSSSSSKKSHDDKLKRKMTSSEKKPEEKKKKREPLSKPEILLSSDDDDDDDICYDSTTVMLNDDDSDEVPEVVPSKNKKETSLKRTNGSHKHKEAREERRSTGSDSAPVVPPDDNQAAPDKKRRIAHSTRLGFPPPKPKQKVIRPVISSVGQVLAERWKKQQELKLNPTEPKIADDDSTRIGCQPKGAKRVAHQTKPQDSTSLPRPKITPSPSKVPAIKRQFVLDQLINICLELYPEQIDAYAKAVELELAILTKATTSNIYTTVFISQKRLLEKCTMPPPMGTGLLSMAPAPTMRTIATIGCGADCRIEKIGIITKQIEVKGEFLHKLLSSYILSKAELKEHGFPLPHETEHGRAVLHVKDDRRKKMPKESQRECSRCGIIYSVDNKGMPEKLALDDLCIFHPKRTYKKRRDRTSVEDYYMCCDRPMASEGCEANRYHVSENPHYDHLTNFVSTKRSSRSKHKTGVFALDCEMCITTNGTTCTRVTVIDEHRNQIYDSLVKPETPVLDYLTRFSGITEELLNNGTAKSLRHVQKDLLQIFRAESILIGHSLQGDLMVLKMIHKNVVDTSIVFPHREGLPKRRALKNLAKDFLMRLIQVEESGHDSKEDALACLDLMLYKAKEVAKSL